MKDTLPDWPTPVTGAKVTPSLSIGKLTHDQKRMLWEHLKQYHPNKATEIKCLMEDPNVRILIDTFGGSLLIENHIVPGNLKQLVE